VVPLPASDGPARLPFAFDIAIATRTGDQALLRELDAIVTRKRPEIDRLLARYRVVRL
jgi:hypothetical protein